MSKKSLEDMLDENKQRQDAKTYARRQAIFLALSDDIENAYRKGWSYREIWEALTREGIIDFSYPNFMHYKDKKKRREKEAEKQQARTTEVPEPKGERSEQPRSVPPNKTPGSTRFDLPVFGQNVTRENKRF